MVWLSEEVAQGLDTTGARELMARIPWGTQLPMLKESSTLIGLLADLLSIDWLRERHLDLFGIYLTHCASVEAARQWLIGGVYITEMLKHIVPDEPLCEDRSLAKFTRQVVEGQYRWVLLPANINGNHWILVQINIDQGSFGFGASHILLSIIICTQLVIVIH